MASLSNVFNQLSLSFGNGKSNSDNSSSSDGGVKGSGDVKRTSPKPSDRISVEKLDQAFRYGIIFNAVNKYVQHILASRHYMWYFGDEKARDFFEDFLANLGNTCDTIDWESYLYKVFQYCFAYGKFNSEKVFNFNNSKIIDLAVINPTSIDYARDSLYNVVFDERDRVVGYFVNYSYNSPIQSNPEEVPDGVRIPMGKYIYVPAYKIAQINLISGSDELNPFGLIEPVYGDYLDFIEGKATMKKGFDRFGEPMIITKVGDATHPPTPSTITKTHNEIKEHRGDKVMTTAYYNDIKVVEAKDSFDSRNQVEFFKENMKQGLWIPDIFVTEQGKGSLAKSQLTEFSNSLKSIVRLVVSQLRRQIFEPICILEEIETVPTLVFEQLDPEEKDKKPRRVSAYAKAGLLQDGQISDVRVEDDLIR